MAEIVDARGLSCPEPVLLTLETIKKLGKGEIEILVDTDTSRENVSRAAQSMGWQIVEVQQKETWYRVKISKD
ncbi:sulfurtransferase TusA family protein [Thermodesulfovibrio yellowstonii]|uniref:Preprotein translocase subunit TatB n=1 Tax=Thermodesulfovibrio yellowstonii TaxID=28262 RepID=A0A9W6GFU5_9BACT|nr:MULTISPECIES: sulfurtransferase TusA family protein [Thermodesulfovibrio]MDI6865178.1 sulfurtransferase TusA family protein [Thermodesulfovibrio yellowstonii]GLI53107.1 preprotein translocase subunit TatB [Thermodesulfovibrio islandicus]